MFAVFRRSVDVFDDLDVARGLCCRGFDNIGIEFLAYEHLLGALRLVGFIGHAGDADGGAATVTGCV